MALSYLEIGMGSAFFYGEYKAMKQFEVEIEDRKYQMFKLNVDESLSMASKVANMLKGVNQDNLDPMSFITSIMGHEDYPALVKKLVSTATVNGMKLKYDEHFSEYPSDLIQLAAHSFKESVYPFLDINVLAGLMESLMGQELQEE